MVELLGSSAGELLDRPVADVLPLVHPGDSDAVIDLRGGTEDRRLSHVRQFERIHDGVVTGWDLVIVLEP